jgi:signal transduction histidine kinase
MTYVGIPKRYNQKLIFRSVLIYLILGLLWISFSDYVIFYLIEDPVITSKISFIKGYIFVILTSILIYVIVKSNHKDLVDHTKLIYEVKENEQLYQNYLFKTLEDLESSSTKLSQTKTLLSNIVNELPLIIWSIDHSGKLINNFGDSLNLLDLNIIDTKEINFLELTISKPLLHEVTLEALKGKKMEWIYNINDEIYECLYMPVLDGSNGNNIIHGLALNITDRKRALEEVDKLQSSIAYQSKMNAIGRLTNIIAHDFNNYLSSIRGNIEFALYDLKNEENTEFLEIVIKIVDEATDMISQLKNKEIYKIKTLEKVDLVKFLKSYEKYYQQSVSPAKLKILHNGNSAPVMIDSEALNQAILNLLYNAKAAVYNHGEIDILLSSYDAIIILEVRDNGIGIPEELIDRIFEPYFSTKQDFGGTGLGLYSVYNTISRFSGRISAMNNDIGGATFQIQLPRKND